MIASIRALAAVDGHLYEEIPRDCCGETGARLAVESCPASDFISLNQNTLREIEAAQQAYEPVIKQSEIEAADEGNESASK